eukprot:6200136-Pleurochrysis_carterae.AAC.1
MMTAWAVALIPAAPLRAGAVAGRRQDRAGPTSSGIVRYSEGTGHWHRAFARKATYTTFSPLWGEGKSCWLRLWWLIFRSGAAGFSFSLYALRALR